MNDETKVDERAPNLSTLTVVWLRVVMYGGTVLALVHAAWHSLAMWMGWPCP